MVGRAEAVAWRWPVPWPVATAASGCRWCKSAAFLALDLRRADAADEPALEVVSGTVMLLATRSAIRAGPLGDPRPIVAGVARRDSEATDVEVGRGEGVERRQGLRGAVEAPLALEGAALVDDGDDRRPGRACPGWSRRRPATTPCPV